MDDESGESTEEEVPVIGTGMTVDEEKLVVDSSDHVQHTEAY